LGKPLEWPKPKVPKKETSIAKKTVPKRISKKELSVDRGSSSTPVPSGALKRKAHSLDFDDADSQQAGGSQTPADDDLFGDEDAEGENEPMDEDGVDYNADIAPSNPTKAPPVTSKKDEIEKLRTSGSMTQNLHEIARVKNLNKIQIGKHFVEPWYFSPYPKEYSGLPILYICEFCLHYLPSPVMFSRHRKKCQMLHPPGNEIYRCDEISFFELDGKKQLTWCRNLSLLSKCFLDQ
jgi:histone acetyltransferase HTATIP